MDGLTVKNANKFLDTGSVREFKTQKLESVFKASEGQKSFAEVLKDNIEQVNELQKVANQKMEELATGKTDNIPEVMIAAEKADIALKLMVQMRNKIIEAYQEVMKMQV